MAVLKQIAGHTGCARIKAYLERDGRALEREFMNFDWQAEENEIETSKLAPLGFDWARIMDWTRKAEGNDLPYNGKRARTFKHFVISPSPKDHITFDELRALAQRWLKEEFPDFEAVIVYHDDNEGHIPHAHIVVNNTNLKTGRRMHNEDARDLNRDLQKMAQEMGLAYFENEEPLKPNAQAKEPSVTPRTEQAVHYSRAEERITREGGYSWLSDIRCRIDAAKYLSADVKEFRANLKALGVSVEDSKSQRHRPDWVYGLIDSPGKRVCGEKLGILYGKQEMLFFYSRRTRVSIDGSSRNELLSHAKNAVTLNDLSELYNLASALDVCSRYRVSSIEGLEARIAKARGQAVANGVGQAQVARSNLKALEAAKDFMSSRNLLPLHEPPHPQKPPRRNNRTSPRGEALPTRSYRPGTTHRQPPELETRRDRERSR